MSINVLELKYMDSNGKEVWVLKTLIRPNCLQTFILEFLCLQHNMNVGIVCETECGEITIMFQMVLDKVTKLNPSKSLQPGLLHPRILYETRQVIAYPLKLLNLQFCQRICCISATNHIDHYHIGHDE